MGGGCIVREQGEDGVGCIVRASFVHMPGRRIYSLIVSVLTMVTFSCCRNEKLRALLHATGSYVTFFFLRLSTFIRNSELKNINMSLSDDFVFVCDIMHSSEYSTLQHCMRQGF